MPQLDYTTYTSQIFWLLIIFGILYFISLYYILPTLAGLLKYRFKKLNFLNRNISYLKNEELSLIDDHDELIREVIISTRTIMIQLFSSNWIDSTNVEVNHNGLKSLNEEYLNSMVQIAAKKYIIHQYI